MYLLPEPQKWIREEGYFWIPYDGKIVLQASCDSRDYDTAVILAEDLETYGGLHIAITRGTSRKAAVTLGIDKALGREAYRLLVDSEGISVTGGSGAGLFYGAATLRQMIRQEGGRIPCARIEDAPRMEVRGYYYDVTRGRIPTMEYLKKLADKLAFYKINQLQLYIEHSYLFEGLTEVWRDDTPLTGEEILELDAYCRKRNIELVPSLSCFGHLYKLLRTKTCRHLCELPDPDKEPFGFVDRMRHHTVDVSDPESMALIKRMIEEYLPLFTSEYFNIGADETFDLGKGKNRARAEAEGTRGMYMDFVRELCTFLVEKGKKPMFWGDIIADFPEAVHKLPKETICLNWGYEADQPKDAVKALAEAGAVQYCCPGVSGWNQFVNRLDVAYENIRRMCTYAAEYGAAGVLTTDWGDFGHVNHPDFGMPGMIYGAAFSWNTKIPEFEEINRRISRMEYQDDSESLAGIAAKLPGLWTFQWKDAVMHKEGKELEVSSRDLEKTPEILERLEELAGELYGVIPHLPAEERGRIEPYLIAVRGMELFQKIGSVILPENGNKQGFSRKEKQELASELEEWFYHYKRIWRSVSRESELYRIQEVIFWYADQLRDPADL